MGTLCLQYSVGTALAPARERSMPGPAGARSESDFYFEVDSGNAC